MYVDPNDDRHLHSELKKDRPRLLQKLEHIRRQIENKLKGVKKKDPKKHQKSWKNYETNIVWEIRYLVFVEKFELNITFNAITSFEADGELHYIHLDQDNINKMQKGDVPIIRIYRSHFISSFKRRLGVELTAYEVIVQFLFIEDMFKVQNFTQNKHWCQFLYKYGVAFVRLGKDIVNYDTFISMKDLKPDQKHSIHQHFNEKEPYTYLLIMLHLYENPEWREFFNEDDILKSMSKIHPKLLEGVFQTWKDFKRLRDKTT